MLLTNKGELMATQNRTVDLTVKLDSYLKARGEALFNSLGMDFSTAVGYLVRHSVSCGKLPLDLPGLEPGWAPPAYNSQEEYMAELRRRVAELDAGINTVTVPASHFDDVDEV